MGLATAGAFAEAGASETLADLKEETVREAAELLPSPATSATTLRYKPMVERTVAEFGQLDAAFNKAGVMAKNAPTANNTLEEFDRVSRVNLRGV